MGLIYVNPEGPNGNPDPVASGRDIRETFARMAMNDEETVALIAGGHTFGKCHGAGDAVRTVGPEPEAAPIEEQGLGWNSSTAAARAGDTITSGIEGAWKPEPDEVGHGLPRHALRLRVGAGQEPRRRWQWHAKDAAPRTWSPTRTTRRRSTAPMMTTADLALKFDPIYSKISKRFHENPDEFADAFAKAWFKLTHRDMGPRSAISARRCRTRC
jgi:catalase-peroxidase